MKKKTRIKKKKTKQGIVKKKRANLGERKHVNEIRPRGTQKKKINDTLTV